jgi:hypothetical protein
MNPNHKQGCPALGGYGHGKEECICGAMTDTTPEALRTSAAELICKYCRGQGWVCENHQDVPWDDGDQSCCGGAGMPCRCNTDSPPWKYHGEPV